MVAATRTVVRPSQFEAGNLIDWISDPKIWATISNKESTITLSKSDKEAPRKSTFE
jgi:hypothetical protein